MDEVKEEERGKQKAIDRRKSYDELVATLPLEERWGLPLRCYQNYWYAEPSLAHIMAIQHSFEARPSDIFLVTQPKSGTTWLKALAFAIINRKHHDPSDENHPLLVSNPHECVPFVFSYYDELSQLPSDKLGSLPSPRLIAFHFPYSGLPKSVLDLNCRIVYLSRDVKDTLVSHWHFFDKLQPLLVDPLTFSEGFELFSKGICALGSVWDHYVGYLAEFVGCPFLREEEERGVVEKIVRLCSFENLSRLEVNKKGYLDLNLKDVQAKNLHFFREGKPGGWKKWMSVEMAHKLYTIMEEKMKAKLSIE